MVLHGLEDKMLTFLVSFEGSVVIDDVTQELNENLKVGSSFFFSI